jgi:hypothetical protein
LSGTTDPDQENLLVTGNETCAMNRLPMKAFPSEGGLSGSPPQVTTICVTRVPEWSIVNDTLLLSGRRAARRSLAVDAWAIPTTFVFEVGCAAAPATATVAATPAPAQMIPIRHIGTIIRLTASNGSAAPAMHAQAGFGCRRAASSASIRVTWARSSRSRSILDASQARYSSRVWKILLFRFIVTSFDESQDGPHGDGEVGERDHDRPDLAG